MGQIDSRIEESKNWFERAAEHVPGYKGYKKKELRREADKLQREYVAERLEAARVAFETSQDGLFLRDPSQNGLLFTVDVTE